MNHKEKSIKFLVIGRNNYKKKSRGIDHFISEAFGAGGEIFFFKTQKQILAEEVNKSIHDGLNSSPKSLKHILNFIFLNTKIMRRLIQFAFLTINPRSAAKATNVLLFNTNPTKQLESFINEFNAQKIVVIAHSAGGILAAKIEYLKNIHSCICFGYPFKHPEKDEESYRTTPLQFLKKPFIIVQGTEDEYGSPSKLQDYRISSSVKIISIKSTHNYEEIQEHDQKKIIDQLLDMEMNRPGFSGGVIS